MGQFAPSRRAHLRPAPGNRAADPAIGATWPGRRRPEPRQWRAALAPGDGVDPSGGDGPLNCLAGGPLASQFHSWRGASGKRYVCSVFPVLDGAELGGMPEFDGAVALAVSRDACGRRQKIAVLDLSWRDGRFTGDLACAGNALRSGACEWHVHLLAADSAARRAAINDIAS